MYYEYGDANTGNQSGRLVKMQDASGVQTFSYGKLGELIENNHTFVMPAGETYTFMTQWEYDSWNRTKSITYADGEVVSYGYDDAGNLVTMSGQKGSQTYSYLESVAYDKFGSRVRMDYGNGTINNYFYNPINRRLSRLQSFSLTDTMQDITYSYDLVGNILSDTNHAGLANSMGGQYNYQHAYDSLYRLVNSVGQFGTDYSYQLQMAYSATGNITNKTLSANTLIGGLEGTINYNRNYSYYTTKPHAAQTVADQVSQLDMQISWDANGNMTMQQTDMGDDEVMERRLCWDEENRLMSVKDNLSMSSYLYNAGGERVWKFTGAVEQMTLNGKDYFDVANLTEKTLYTSPYMVLTNREYTKHYFSGSERIASKIGGGFALCSVDMRTDVADKNADYHQISQDLHDLLHRSGECVGIRNGFLSLHTEFEFLEESLHQDEIEENQYFYHTDHLGSSSWISDASGEAYQHLQNMPYGEQFIEQRQSSWGAVYQFTGYEKDQETGFDYAHARYYSSDLSIFLSVDPLSDMYPSTSGYMYTLGNPVMLVDPNGMNAWIPPTEEGGTWTAEEGDSPGSLARDAGISQAEAEQVMRDYNASNGNNRSSDIMVYKGDQVTVPGSGTNNTGSSSSAGTNSSTLTTPTPTASSNSSKNSGNSRSPMQTVNDVNTATGIVLSAAQQTIQNTKVGSDVAYWLSGNTKALNGVSNTFKYAPYVGLFVTVGTGTYLAKTIDPTTNQPYQSWVETGADIGVNVATIYIGAQYGGWYGAGAALFYIGVKTNVQYQIDKGINPGSLVIIYKE